MKQVRVIDGLHGEAKGSAVSGIERVDWGWGYGKATVYKLRLADRCVMLQSCLSQVCYAGDTCTIHSCYVKLKARSLRCVDISWLQYLAWNLCVYMLCKIVELRSGRALANQSRVHNNVILLWRCRERTMHTVSLYRALSALWSGSTDKPGGRGWGKRSTFLPQSSTLKRTGCLHQVS